ncbi:hypothetical protein GCM10023200_20490 [Actinomycetospora chlora]|uniref:Uncharacterized protein n=1 Tax=Actinomycetospora chlora TaxID=663608 RepID=A0ABP9AXI9_9PSEU
MSAPTADRAALGEVEEHLSAVLAGLGAPPADRDPLLWAAHEAALCARELLAMRTGGDGAGSADWSSVLASARASMAAVSYARREAGS